MIKVIIFDFDDTIYIGETWDRWIDYIHDALMFFLKDEQKYQELAKIHKINRKMGTKTIVQIAKKIGINPHDMVEYIKTHNFEHACNELQTLPDEFFKELKQKCSLYIVSMSTQSYCYHYLERFNIDKTHFRNVLSMDLIDEQKTKGHIYEDIAREEGVKESEVLVIGDNFENDIVPAQRKNMKYLHFDNDFNTIYDYLEKNKIMDCSKYKRESI